MRLVQHLEHVAAHERTDSMHRMCRHFAHGLGKCRRSVLRHHFFRDPQQLVPLQVADEPLDIAALAAECVLRVPFRDRVLDAQTHTCGGDVLRLDVSRHGIRDPIAQGVQWNDWIHVESLDRLVRR